MGGILKYCFLVKKMDRLLSRATTKNDDKSTLFKEWRAIFKWWIALLREMSTENMTMSSA